MIVVLQEMHYTLGNVDMGLGIITAERTSENRLAPISRETAGESEIPVEVKTFCLFPGTLVFFVFFLPWFFGDQDDDDQENARNYERRHWSRPRHHHPSPIFVDSNDYGSDSYRYTMTIALEDIYNQQTRIRVTVQGQHLEGMNIKESGPVQDWEFYTDFFNRLQLALNR